MEGQVTSALSLLQLQTPAGVSHCQNPTRSHRARRLVEDLHLTSLLGHQTGRGRAENGHGASKERTTTLSGSPSGEFIMTSELLIDYELDLIN